VQRSPAWSPKRLLIHAACARKLPREVASGCFELRCASSLLNTTTALALQAYSKRGSAPGARPQRLAGPGAGTQRLACYRTQTRPLSAARPPAAMPAPRAAASSPLLLASTPLCDGDTTSPQASWPELASARHSRQAMAGVSERFSIVPLAYRPELSLLAAAQALRELASASTAPPPRSCMAYAGLLLGPRFLPKPTTARTASRQAQSSALAKKLGPRRRPQQGPRTTAKSREASGGAKAGRRPPRPAEGPRRGQELPWRGLRPAKPHADSPTFTKRRLYFMRFMARPRGFFFFSCFGTLGVWPRTLPARASEPWTLPAT
jgi:hypothetical protein